jgi:hypothetical protein
MLRTSSLALAVLAVPSLAVAQNVPVRVTVENLAPADDISFAPLRVGFGNGTFDAFDLGTSAGAGIVSIAEGGVGDVWFADFAAAEPQAQLGSVLPAPLLPGGTASTEFVVDTDANPFFTFGSMVIPSNDLFLGNDLPTQYRLFDDAGNLLISSIEQTAAEIWDANSEVAIVENGAFVVGGTNAERVDEGGVIAFDFSELSVFDGATTPAGYTLDTNLTSSTPVYRISFEVVPEPATAGVVGLVGLATLRRRR